MRFIAVLLCWVFFHATLSGQIVLLRRKQVAAAGGGSVTYDAVSSAQCIDDATGCAAGDTQLTIAHTTGSGSNRGMVAACAVSGSSGSVQPNVSTATYAGVSLTQLAKRDANYDLYLFTLPDGTQPTTGTNNFVVTLASALVGGSFALSCAVITASGVNQTTAWTVSDATGAGSGTTASATLSASGTGDLVIVASCAGSAFGAAGGGITSRATISNGAGACNSLAIGTAPGNTTALSWAITASDSWMMLGAAFKAN